ncbi:hypothetical protein ACFLQV_03840 [Calditrichota bacterium]
MRIFSFILIAIGIAGCVITFLGLSLTAEYLVDDAYVYSGNRTAATVLGDLIQDRITILYSDIYGGNEDTSSTPELKVAKDSTFAAQARLSVEEVLSYETIKDYFDPDYYHLDFIEELDDSGLDEKYTTFALDLFINGQIVYQNGNTAKSLASGLIYDVPKYERLRGFKVKIYSSLKYEQMSRTNIAKIKTVFFLSLVFLVVGVMLILVKRKSS